MVCNMSCASLPERGCYMRYKVARICKLAASLIHHVMENNYKHTVRENIKAQGYSQKILIVERPNDQFELEIKGNGNFELEPLQLIAAARLIDPSSKIIVNEDLFFLKNIFDQPVTLANCILNGTVTFRECVFQENADFRDAEFKMNVSFTKSKFEKKVRFHHAKFLESVKFENTKFHDLVDFYNATFQNTQQFFLTDFLGVTIFSHTKFNKQIQFLYCKTSKETVISFENATFSQSLDISRANFWCKISFWKIHLTVVPTEFWLYENDEIAEEKIERPKTSLRMLRETYRIIKDSYNKEGNQIEVLEFYKNEMLLFKEEQKYKGRWRLTEDSISLFFNKESNKFGTSWWQGIKFTFFVTTIFYALFLLTFCDEITFRWTKKAISETIKHFFEFLNITKWDIKPFGIKDYNWGYVILFIGRIFIGYGYYQIVQAFRKFGKN